MGYDEDECFFCYTCNNWNEPTENTMEVCFNCIEKYAGKIITARLLSVFSNPVNINGNIPCNVCKEIKKFVCSVRCCQPNEHFKN